MSFINNWEIRNISLTELAPLTCNLMEEVARGRFEPDCIVYLETGARLLAVEACRFFSISAIPIKIQRPGAGAKSRLVKVLNALPICAKDLLRQLEARVLWRNKQVKRKIIEAPKVDLTGYQVLILDDAVDTCASVEMARNWVLSCGAQSSQVKVAALTLTTVMAKQSVDFALFKNICRFPWSSDSIERVDYERIYEKAIVPVFGLRNAIKSSK